MEEKKIQQQQKKIINNKYFSLVQFDKIKKKLKT
jgi:hypothetical protein